MRNYSIDNKCCPTGIELCHYQWPFDAASDTKTLGVSSWY